MNSTMRAPRPPWPARTAAAVLAFGGLGALSGTELLTPPLAATLTGACRRPRAPENAARRVFLAHGIGLAAGLIAAAWLGVHPQGEAEGLRWREALSPALAVGLTTSLCQALDAVHLPALATTCLAALGIVGPGAQAGELLLGTTSTAGALALATRGAPGGRSGTRAPEAGDASGTRRLRGQK